MARQRDGLGDQLHEAKIVLREAPRFTPPDVQHAEHLPVHGFSSSTSSVSSIMTGVRSAAIRPANPIPIAMRPAASGKPSAAVTQRLRPSASTNRTAAVSTARSARMRLSSSASGRWAKGDVGHGLHLDEQPGRLLGRPRRILGDR